ncbi:MAG: hypothetical protein AAGJ19_11475 [Myxococcota bacterium]
MTTPSGSGPEVDDAARLIKFDKRPWLEGLLTTGGEAEVHLKGGPREVLWTSEKAVDEMTADGLGVSKGHTEVPFQKGFGEVLDAVGRVVLVLELAGLTREMRVKAFRKLARHLRGVTGYATWQDNYSIFAACALAEYLDGLYGEGKWSLSRETYKPLVEVMVIDATEAETGDRHVLVMEMDAKFEVRPADDALRVQVLARKLLCDHGTTPSLRHAVGFLHHG